MRNTLNSLEGISATWKVALGQVDKSCQAYFQVDDDLNTSEVKSRLDQALQSFGYCHQGSYIPTNSCHIFYHFLKSETINTLLQTPIILNNRSYYPRRPCYVQPIYGLKLTVAGVGDLTQARSVIDNYIKHHFQDSSTEPVVCHSCLMLDDSVYCVILHTPKVTQQVLAACDNFKPFGDSIITPDKLQYLYTLNAPSIPLSFSNRYSSSTSQPNPLIQCQLDRVNAQSEATAASLKGVVSNVKQLACDFQQAQATLTNTFSSSAVYSANNLLTSAQFNVSTLQQTITTHNMILSITSPDRQLEACTELETLRERLRHAKTIMDSRAAEVLALQASQHPALPPVCSSPSTSPNTHTAQKRPRLESDDSMEEDQVTAMTATMEVDLLVCKLLHSLSNFFNVFSVFLHVSAKCVNFLLTGFQSHVLVQSDVQPKAASSSQSSFYYPPLSYFFTFIIFTLLFSQIISAFPASSPLALSSTMFTVSINVNGLFDPMKINAIQDMVHTSQPCDRGNQKYKQGCVQTSPPQL